jgi:hypothetical protein
MRAVRRSVAVFGSLFTRAVHPHADRPAYLHSVATGTQHIFLTASVLCLAGFIAALLIKEVPLRGKPTAPAPADGHPAAHDTPSPAGR